MPFCDATTSRKSPEKMQLRIKLLILRHGILRLGIALAEGICRW
jgi:hypothetical protein